MSAGLTQAQVGALVGRSSSEISRTERGESPHVPYETIVLMAAVLGLDVPLRAFPGGEPVRDAPQLALLARFRERVPGLGHVPEVAVGGPGDRRAWDEVAVGRGWSIPIEAETRLRDVQALERRLALKLRDSEFDRLILLVADTRHNRHVLRLAEESLRGLFPIPGRFAVAAMKAGHRPPGSAIVRL